MQEKPIFADQVEKFTMLIDALLSNEETSDAFTEAPLETLKKYGIEFTDAGVAKKVEAELKEIAKGLTIPDPEGLSPQYFARTLPRPRIFVATRIRVVPNPFTEPRPLVSPRVIVAPRMATASYVRAASVTIVAKGDREDVWKIDEGRVDAFMTKVDLENRIAALEEHIIELEAELAKR